MWCTGQELSMICVLGGSVSVPLLVEVGIVQGREGLWNVRGSGGEGEKRRRVSNWRDKSQHPPRGKWRGYWGRTITALTLTSFGNTFA